MQEMKTEQTLKHLSCLCHTPFPSKRFWRTGQWPDVKARARFVDWGLLLHWNAAIVWFAQPFWSATHDYFHELHQILFWPSINSLNHFIFYYGIWWMPWVRSDSFWPLINSLSRFRFYFGLLINSMSRSRCWFGLCFEAAPMSISLIRFSISFGIWWIPWASSKFVMAFN